MMFDSPDFQSLAAGVGSRPSDDEQSFPAVGGAHGGSRYARPRSHVPERGQVCDGSGKFSSGNDG